MHQLQFHDNQQDLKLTTRFASLANIFNCAVGTLSCWPILDSSQVCFEDALKPFFVTILILNPFE